VDTVTTQTPAALSSPSVPPLPAATRAALDRFFRAFGFTAPEELSRLATWALEGAGAESSDAVGRARARMETWLAAVLGPTHGGPDTLLVRGRAAFVLCDAARWGSRVITRGPGALSLEQTRELRTSVPVPAPRPLPTAMPEQQVVLWPLGEFFRRGWRAGEPGVSASR